MSRSEFWKSRQAEFEKYASQYSDLRVHWNGSHRLWFFWWGETKDGINVPQEAEDVFKAIARKAVTHLPMTTATAGAEPWSDWLDYMRARRWALQVTGHTACTELEWDAGVRDGKPLVAVRKELGYTAGDEWTKVYVRTDSDELRLINPEELRGQTSNDLEQYYHWLEDGTIEQVFASSARLCEDLASRVFEWEVIRKEFESLPEAEYVLIWTSNLPMSLMGEQLPNHWSWSHPRDSDLVKRANTVIAKASKARGYDSEDGWLDELRKSEFVKFQIAGSGRHQLADETYEDYEFGPLKNAVKHSVTRCSMLETECLAPADPSLGTATGTAASARLVVGADAATREETAREKPQAELTKSMESSNSVSPEIQPSKVESTAAAHQTTFPKNRHLELLKKILTGTTMAKWAQHHKLGRTSVFDWRAAISAGIVPKGKVSPEKRAEIEKAIEDDAVKLGLETGTDADPSE